MKVYRSPSEIELRDTTIAIGVFDGVHRGHQKVLRRARESASFIPNGISLALTFDIHPAELVAPDHAPTYICSLSQRLELIEEHCPVDAVLVVPFDGTFAELTAHQFVKDILVDHLGATRVFVGADFRYGKGRSGGVMDLEAAGDNYHFGVEVIHSVALHGERVSSTSIRKIIGRGDMGSAQKLLDHPFAIRGKVVEGKRLGRTLGYPTANIQPEQYNQQMPALGVYAAFVKILEGDRRIRKWPAAVSVGVNPTTDNQDGWVKIEAFILDGFDRDIYGETLDIEFVEMLRPEAKFASLDALKEQIGMDVERAEVILSSNKKFFSQAGGN
jgi:riboflavin kinase/FMN adenylyltransferase